MKFLLAPNSSKGQWDLFIMMPNQQESVHLVMTSLEAATNLIQDFESAEVAEIVGTEVDDDTSPRDSGSGNTDS